MWQPVIKTPNGIHLVVEEYRISGQHFTRSIVMPPGGGICAEIFTFNKLVVADGVAWREKVNQARIEAEKVD